MRDVTCRLQTGTQHHCSQALDGSFPPTWIPDYKESGIGRGLDTETLEDYSQTKSVVVNHGDVPNVG